MAEELGLDQALGHGREVQADQGLARPAQRMDGAHHELLAGAALALHEHGHVEPGHGRHLLAQPLHHRAVAHQFGHSTARLAQAVELAAVELQLRAQLLHLGRHLGHGLGVAEHDLAHGADDLAIAPHGPPVHHARDGIAELQRLADLGLARFDHRTQPRVADHLLHGLARATARRQAQELLVHGAHVAHGAGVVGHGDALVGVGQDLLEDVEGEGNGGNEVEQRGPAVGRAQQHELQSVRTQRGGDARPPWQRQREQCAVARFRQCCSQRLLRGRRRRQSEGRHHGAVAPHQHAQRGR